MSARVEFGKEKLQVLDQEFCVELDLCLTMKDGNKKEPSLNMSTLSSLLFTSHDLVDWARVKPTLGA